MLHPEAYAAAIQFGLKPDRLFVLPNCVPAHVSMVKREDLRRHYGYTDDDFVVLCVAAWNRGHKRIDYVIREVAQISDAQIHLCLCGQSQPGSDQLISYGREALGARLQCYTLAEADVRDLMTAADVLVLASLNEAFGNVLVEAAYAGLPVICHSHAAARYILEDEYWMRDLSQTGNLKAAILERRATGCDHTKIRELRTQCWRRFAPDAVATQFLQLVQDQGVVAESMRQPLGPLRDDPARAAATYAAKRAGIEIATEGK